MESPLVRMDDGPRRTEARRREKQKAPVLRPMVLRLSTKYLDTDASDDETDWEDF
jgi:hypothetical protein